MTEKLTNAIKEKATKFYDVIVDIIDDERVQKVSRFANTIVETYFYVDKENIFSFGAGVVSLLASGMDVFAVSDNAIDRYVKRKKLKTLRGGIPRILEISGLIREYPTQIVVTDSEQNVHLHQVRFPFGIIWYSRFVKEGQWYDPYFYIEDNFPLSDLFELIWSKYPNGIFVPRLKNYEQDFEYSLNILPLETSTLEFVGDKPSLDDETEKVRKFKEHGISRSFLYGGDPGSGKTAFAISLAKRFSNRVIKIDPSAMDQIDASFFEFLLENLKPDFVILDDFDRIQHRQQFMLFALESLKQKYPKVTIIATVNDFTCLDHAIVRPGRFDGTLWFARPNSAGRRMIISHYLEKNQVKLTKAKLNEIVKATSRFTGAYLRDLCLRIATMGYDHYEEIIAEYRKILSMHEENKKQAEVYEDDEAEEII